MQRWLNFSSHPAQSQYAAKLFLVIMISDYPALSITAMSPYLEQEVFVCYTALSF